jgi:hypothetical protein
MDTKSKVAHNVNEQMQQNQHGGCTMMAMGHFLPRWQSQVLTPPALAVGAGLVGFGDKKPGS